MPDADSLMSEKVVYLLKPRGFCAGVVARSTSLRWRSTLRADHVRRESSITAVVEDLPRAADFCRKLGEVPAKAVLFIALTVFLPLCGRRAGAAFSHRRHRPLVTKVHQEAVRCCHGRDDLLIGHRELTRLWAPRARPNHTIVVSCREEAEQVSVPDPNHVFYLTQTTLSLDEAEQVISALKRRFPKIQGPPAQDICYATENRQQAVKRVAPSCELLLVVGSENSSNSKRLVEVGVNAKMRGYLIDDERDIRDEWFEGVQNVMVTAGASAPEVLVQRVIRHLARHDFNQVEEVEAIKEDVMFPLPPELAGHQSRLTTIANA
jgi:4-hydroxy-3-methylbut-2-enyl diphosphate reductase